MKKTGTIIISFFIFFFFINIQACTNAFLVINKESSFEGYTLYTPEFSKNVFLMDNNGKIVHRWETDYFQGLPVYLLENGNLLRGDTQQFSKNFFLGGVTGHVGMYDWNGSLIWEFLYTNETVLLHNDIEPLPNGNILMIGWEKINNTDAIQAGCKPKWIQSKDVWSDIIIEVEPIFPNGGKIVWEWHAWDHLIQNFDSTKQNYGNVSDHPELIDINFEGNRRPAPNQAVDLFHINSVDYIEEFDQLLLNARNPNEIWIIDHSTNKEESSSHTGGKYGKGGDLLYRWGNPQVYNRGSEDDQQLFMQHDARWFESNKSGKGHVTIFNNGYQRPKGNYSSVIELILPVNESGKYKLNPDKTYGPKEPVWTYTTGCKELLYSPFISGAQRLPNNNTFICSGEDGVFLEVTPEKNIVWMYINLRPFPFINHVFKTQSYPSDYPGLRQLNDS
ncbi:MAG: aryl-sulfate sulfotransferase [Candidatus Thermoplasmatota archaeon]